MSCRQLVAGILAMVLAWIVPATTLADASLAENVPAQTPYGFFSPPKLPMDLQVSPGGQKARLFYRTATDTLLIEVPLFEKVLDPLGFVTVVVNGEATWEIPAADFHASPEWVPSPLVLQMAEEIDATMNDPEGFVQAAVAWGSDLEDRTSQIAQYGFDSLACWSCGISLLAYGIAIASLVAACGGTAGIGCIIAFVALNVDKASVLASCYSCFN